MGGFSRWLNGVTGGRRDQTLCRRIAGQHGADCWFCRAIGALLRDSLHCARELDGGA